MTIPINSLERIDALLKAAEVLEESELLDKKKNMEYEKIKTKSDRKTFSFNGKLRQRRFKRKRSKTDKCLKELSNVKKFHLKIENSELYSNLLNKTALNGANDQEDTSTASEDEDSPLSLSYNSQNITPCKEMLDDVTDDASETEDTTTGSYQIYPCKYHPCESSLSTPSTNLSNFNQCTGYITAKSKHLCNCCHSNPNTAKHKITSRPSYRVGLMDCWYCCHAKIQHKINHHDNKIKNRSKSRGCYYVKKCSSNKNDNSNCSTTCYRHYQQNCSVNETTA